MASWFFSVRVILFSVIWAVTLGRHYFWLLPNLNEDVGIIESFIPLYHHEYVPKTDKSADSKDKPKTDDKRKNSDAAQTMEDSKPADSSDKQPQEDSDKKDDDSKASSESENDNGYEIVNVDELTTGDGDQLTEESKKDV